MVEKIYIVWCKTNKGTVKFDLGVFIDRKKADNIIAKHRYTLAEIWIEERKLSKPLSEGT